MCKVSAEEETTSFKDKKSNNRMEQITLVLKGMLSELSESF